MKIYFDHEKLNVYQAAIEFVSWVDALIESLPKSLAVTNQLDRASTSIPVKLVGLIRSTSVSRVHEEQEEYGSTHQKS